MTKKLGLLGRSFGACFPASAGNSYKISTGTGNSSTWVTWWRGNQTRLGGPFLPKRLRPTTLQCDYIPYTGRKVLPYLIEISLRLERLEPPMPFFGRCGEIKAIIQIITGFDQWMLRPTTFPFIPGWEKCYEYWATAVRPRYVLRSEVAADRKATKSPFGPAGKKPKQPCPVSLAQPEPS